MRATSNRALIDKKYSNNKIMQCYVDVKSLNRIALIFTCNYAYTNVNQLSISCDTV